MKYRTRAELDGAGVDTVVIGGGQTGLTIGYHLAGAGRDFVVLDASERPGDPWRNRWDSLRLFTMAGHCALPGLDLPMEDDTYIGKDEMADYIEAYARHLDLPLYNGTRVTRLSHDGSRYVVEFGDGRIYADNVVVAMADFQVPKVPEFAPDLDPDIVQIHSGKYRNPAQLQEGPVLVVGMGNSGADIGIEVAQTHQTYLAGKETAHIPFRIESWLARRLLVHVVKFVMTKVLNTSTPIGRRARPKMLGKAAPLVRVKPKDLAEATVRVGRVTGVVDGRPQLDDGRVLDVANVIWCTGFGAGFDWIDLPVFDDQGRPRHQRGIVDDHPGLYFCGLFFLHSFWSENLVGMQADAAHIAAHMETSRPAGAMALL